MPVALGSQLRWNGIDEDAGPEFGTQHVGRLWNHLDVPVVLVLRELSQRTGMQDHRVRRVVQQALYASQGALDEARQVAQDTGRGAPEVMAVVHRHEPKLVREARSEGS